MNKAYKISVACGGKERLETEKIDKIAERFSKDVSSGKMHSPKFMDVVFFNVWKAMALSDDPIDADARYWKRTGLINYDFSPQVGLSPVKKIFSKLMSFILKRVL